MMSNHTGRLYIVATPIGHLQDISFRAVNILQQVALIAAEDTRHSRRLLQHYNIQTPLIALHEHNEDQISQQLLQKLIQGEEIALISDAGTPLISDPGFPLVQLCHEHHIPISPIPGASALIAALSASGLPVHRFCFYGFLPRKSAARQRLFQDLSAVDQTLIFYESSHRIMSSLNDIQTVLGQDRLIALARELTKQYEQIIRAPVAEVMETLKQNPDHQKGEFVLLIAPQKASGLSAADQRLLKILIQEMPLKQAVKLAAQISGKPKNELYQWALKMNFHSFSKI